MKFAVFLISVLLPSLALADDLQIPDMTAAPVGFAALAIFGLAYLLVMAEEFTNLRKSKPVILAAGIIWVMIAITYRSYGLHTEVEHAVRHYLLEYAELMLFLLVAMTYINALDERNLFAALRSWLIQKQFSLQQLFWITGVLTFLISPIADNLTTALLMSAVVMAVGGDNRRFVLLACVNIVVAANAGGAFSPFGDITTLMVWQKHIETPSGVIDFWSFMSLFLPALVNWVLPALVLSRFVGHERPASETSIQCPKRFAFAVVFLFLLTIVTAVSFHSLLGLPPVIGMLTGLAYLQLLGYYLKMTHTRDCMIDREDCEDLGNPVPFDIFSSVARSEWDTLLFFYGVVMCVGGLGFLGYLALASEVMYTQWGPTEANIAVGLMSALVDNIPVMFAVLTMDPEMSQGQWLLVTLTAGVGGSLLSIGSAAGVALMGQSRGMYTFFGHIKWTPVIATGYAASIATHLLLNQRLFT